MFGTMKATRTVQHSFVAKKPDERVELVASTSLAEDQKDLRGLEVLFEPIFKRMGHRFIPCGHRALPVIPDEAQHINSGGLSADSGNLLMLEALKRRFTQPEIVEQQFRAFAAQCEKTDRINIELDIFDLSSHPAHLASIMELCQTPDNRGISPAQIRVELNASPAIDQNVLVDLAQRLKSLGLNIALVNLEPDCFSFERIFKIQPLTVNFNRSWSEEGRCDDRFRDMFSSVVDNLHAMGCFAGLRDVETAGDLAFAQTCGVTRCQGIHFGKPNTSLSKGQIYAI